MDALNIRYSSDMPAAPWWPGPRLLALQEGIKRDESNPGESPGPAGGRRRDSGLQQRVEYVLEPIVQRHHDSGRDFHRSSDRGAAAAPGPRLREGHGCQGADHHRPFLRPVPEGPHRLLDEDKLV